MDEIQKLKAEKDQLGIQWNSIHIRLKNQALDQSLKGYHLRRKARKIEKRYEKLEKELCELGDDDQYNKIDKPINKLENQFQIYEYERQSQYR